MSKKKPPTVTVVLDKTGRAVMSQVEAEATRDKIAADRKNKREARLVYRQRRQLGPWAAAAGVLALGGLLWLFRWDDPAAAVLMAFVLSLVVAFVGWLVGRRAGAWRVRTYVATGLADLWLLLAAVAGPSPEAIAALMLGTVAVSSRWWQQNRIPDPRGPVVPEAVEKRGPIHERWAQYVACKGGPLAGSRLTEHDTTKRGKERYKVLLVPGQQTWTIAIQRNELIASGLNVPLSQMILEPHPDGAPSELLLTVVEVSPIKATVEYVGPAVVDGVIALGPYADGEGDATWRYWTPGEVENGGSVWGGAIIAGMGSGKSRLLELICIGALSTGHCVLWFIDPQGGASSPSLKKAANWYGDLGDASKMLDALELIIAWRGAKAADKEWIGFDPSPENPVLLVAIDEAHEVFAVDAERWATLARKARKVGVCFVILSQYPGLSTFGGSEPLRAAIMAGNVVAMRCESRQNGQLLPGLEVDPLTLPPGMPGFGHTIARGDSRSAPFRARYVKDPDAWLRHYPSPELDEFTANSAGDLYVDRAAEAALQRDALRLAIEAKEKGLTGRQMITLDITRGQREYLARQKAAAVGLDVPEFPDFPAPAEKVVDEVAPAPPTDARGAILARLDEGEARTAELIKAAGVSETRVREVVKALQEEEKVRKVRHGVYARISGGKPE